jgi:hypothetical protein
MEGAWVNEYAITIFCPHEARGNQRVITFVYEDECPKWCESGHELGEDHRSAPSASGEVTFEYGISPADGWTAITGPTAEEHRHRKVAQGAGYEAALIAILGDVEVAYPKPSDRRKSIDPVVQAISPRGEIEDGVRGAIWSDAHITYRMACGICGTNTKRRHELVWPVLEQLRAEHVPVANLRWFEMRLGAHLASVRYDG